MSYIVYLELKSNVEIALGIEDGGELNYSLELVLFTLRGFRDVLSN